MYKIANNPEQFNLINQKIKEVENNENSLFSEITKHCKEEKYAFGIGEEGSLIRNYLISFGLDFVTPEWLTTNAISELPLDWTWYYDTLIRTIIPNYLILQDNNLRALIQYCMDNDVLNVVGKEETYVYVNYILPEHLALFESFEEITIENKT
jgi:hypothetical protein